MLLHILTYLIRVVLISAIIVGLVKLWVKQPEMQRSFEKYRADRRAERARMENLEAYFNKMRAEQSEWFDRAYDKIPAPWRGGRHRAA